MGKEGKYDLRLADPPPITETDSETETEDDEGGPCLVSDVVAASPDPTPAPSKLIRSASIRFLRYFSIIFGLNSDCVQKEASLNFSLFLRDIVQSGFRGFSSNKLAEQQLEDEQVKYKLIFFSEKY